MVKKKAKFNGEPNLIGTMREAVRDVERDKVVTKWDMDQVVKSIRELTNPEDEKQMRDSLTRLEAANIRIALHTVKQTMRIFLDTDEAKYHQAVADGYVIWSPRDMFEYIHLPERERLILARFKERFPGTVEWERLYGGTRG